MASTLVQAADAMVAHLAAQATGPGEPLIREIDAARRFIVRHDLSDLKSDTTARVTVIPGRMKLHRGDGGRKGTRKKTAWLYSFSVAIHRIIPNTTQADDVAEMLQLYEQVNDLFSLERLPGFDSLYWKDSEPQVLFDSEKLDEDGVFIAVQQITFAGRR